MLTKSPAIAAPPLIVPPHAGSKAVAQLPRVIAQPPLIARASIVHAPAFTAARATATRRLPLKRSLLTQPVVVARSNRRSVAEPKMSNLAAPTMAKNGDLVRVAYRAIADKVRLVASIGPTVVAKKTVSSKTGVFAIRPPASDRDGRVMTIRAYAMNGNRSSTLQAMVVLVGPG